MVFRRSGEWTQTLATPDLAPEERRVGKRLTAETADGKEVTFMAVKVDGD